MPFIQVYLHCVWTTKHRTPFLCTPLIRQKMWDHIKVNGASKGIRILNINGHHDHCHCLIDLHGTETISHTIGLLKGESSRWANKSGLIKPYFDIRFSWQHEFWAVSIDKKRLPTLNNYINTQEAHHQDKALDEEIKLFFPEAAELNFD